VALDRAIFLYMDPREKDKNNFAQCKSCVMWTGEKGKTCVIHGKALHVRAQDTCGLYVNGPIHEDMIGKEMKLTVPKESGFEKKVVRCENCRYFEGKSVCLFFRKLNKIPEMDLDEKVHPKGCCNAWKEQILVANK